MAAKNWGVFETGQEVHVIPLDDECDHLEQLGCWCNPSRDVQAAFVIVHHAADGREYDERRRAP
jgi:hypothetical protein